VIVETSLDIKKLNQEQMFSGIRSDESEIRPFYSEYTKLIKDQKGQPTDRVTLKDTGDFYDRIFIDVKKDSFEILSSDYKNDQLIRKYGKRIFGLTRISRSFYIQYSFFVELRERIVKKLGVKFG
jgi:hypothetical protein